MSIENIQNLINDAPQISQWWRTNEKSARRWSAVFCVSYLTLIPMMCVGGLLALVLGFAIIIGESVNDKMVVYIASLLAISLVWSALLALFWPRHLRFKNLKLDYGYESPTDQYKYDTLHKLLQINNSKVQQLAKNIHAIKDIPLPQCWWEEVNGQIKVMCGRPHHETSSEQLAQLYAYIDPQHTASKVSYLSQHSKNNKGSQ